MKFVRHTSLMNAAIECSVTTTVIVVVVTMNVMIIQTKTIVQVGDLMSSCGMC